MSENLNKILGQLEDDLKKLQTAREQVENVVSSNHDFTKAANGLITNTKSLITEIKIATEGVLAEFSEKLTESKVVIDKVVEDSIERFENNIKNVEEANRKLNETAEIKINEVSILASDSIEKNVTQSLATIKDSITFAKKTIEEQQLENLRTLTQILETHNQIKHLIGQLLDLDLPNTLKNINNNIEIIHKVNKEAFQNVRKSQLWLFFGLGVLAIIIVVLKFV